jgi:hypothetical protein
MSFDDDMFDGEPNPGYIEKPGGWCVPADQMPGWPFDQYIPTLRGGITYPKPKGTEMTRRDRVPLQKQLRTAEELRTALDEHIEAMRKLVRDAIPPEPATTSRYAVDIYFTPRGKRYEFLLLRTDDGRWWSTGTSEQTKMFRNWKALYEWLTGPDVHRASDLRVLEYRGADYKLDLGETVPSPQVDF